MRVLYVCIDSSRYKTQLCALLNVILCTLSLNQPTTTLFALFFFVHAIFVKSSVNPYSQLAQRAFATSVSPPQLPHCCFGVEQRKCVKPLW